LHNSLRVLLLKINEIISFFTRVFFSLHRATNCILNHLTIITYYLLLYRAVLMLSPASKVHTQKSSHLKNLLPVQVNRLTVPRDLDIVSPNTAYCPQCFCDWGEQRVPLYQPNFRESSYAIICKN